MSYVFWSYLPPYPPIFMFILKEITHQLHFLLPMCSWAGRPVDAANPRQIQLTTPQLGGRDTHNPSHSVKAWFLNSKFISIKKVASTSCHHRGSGIITRLQTRGGGGWASLPACRVYSITALRGNRDDSNLYTVIISVGHTSSNLQPHRNWNGKPKQLAILAPGARFITPRR